MDYRNGDGSIAEMCGNGVRVFAHYLCAQGFETRTEFVVGSRAGGRPVQVHAAGPVDGEVTVDMGQTRFQPGDVHFDTNGLASTSLHHDTLWTLPLENGLSADISLVAISNPHAVQVVDKAETAPVAETGPLIESHPRFARRVNAGFMQVIDRHTIRLRVYERGAGETLACGTGACAAAVAGIRRGLLDSPVKVHTHGGDLTIEWDGDALRMTGPATTVFTGQIDIDRLLQNYPLKDDTHS